MSFKYTLVPVCADSHLPLPQQFDFFLQLAVLVIEFFQSLVQGGHLLFSPSTQLLNDLQRTSAQSQ
jgi:hypothetical protein